MNLGITIAKDKKGKWEVIDGPNTPFGEQRRNFHKVCEMAVGDYDEVQLISTSGGRVKRKKLKSVVVAPVEGTGSSVADDKSVATNQPEGTPPAGDNNLI